jgi:hypothetical protein
MSASATLKETYEAYRAVWERVCGEWNRTNVNDRAAKARGYRHYLEHKAELDAARDTAMAAHEEWRRSGEPWPFPLFFSKTTHWVVKPPE